MRRTILLSLFAVLAVSAANNACAQHRGGGRPGFTRGGYGFNRARIISSHRFGNAHRPYGPGYTYLPYVSDAANAYDSGYAYPEPAQPVVLVEQPPLTVQPPEPPAVKPVGHSVITEYKWPGVAAATSRSTAAESEPQAFAIVLKDGSTLSAAMIFASDDGLHYVDPDERHLTIAMSAVDRAATLQLNRARNLNLHLPAAQ